MKYALVRFVSTFTRCDGGIPERSYLHEAAWHILELHQSNVSTSWLCVETDVRRAGRALTAAVKHGNSGEVLLRHEPSWLASKAQVKIQYGYCYRSFARGCSKLALCGNRFRVPRTTKPRLGAGWAVSLGRCVTTRTIHGNRCVFVSDDTIQGPGSLCCLRPRDIDSDTILIYNHATARFKVAGLWLKVKSRVVN